MLQNICVFKSTKYDGSEGDGMKVVGKGVG